MKQTFYSNGKLLITGEYLVLDGAKAFAPPTKFGHNLNCRTRKTITKYNDAMMLMVVFGFKTLLPVFNITSTADQKPTSIEAT
jgi:hypothetical protein